MLDEDNSIVKEVLFCMVPNIIIKILKVKIQQIRILIHAIFFVSDPVSNLLTSNDYCMHMTIRIRFFILFCLSVNLMLFYCV